MSGLKKLYEEEMNLLSHIYKEIESFPTNNLKPTVLHHFEEFKESITRSLGAHHDTVNAQQKCEHMRILLRERKENNVEESYQ